MPAVISIFIVGLLWRFLVIFGATVFEGSGLTPRAAQFEARSALVGAGYTTRQSDLVVRHPVCRRVASMLIVSGYFGPAVLIALLGATFVLPTDDDLSVRAVVLAVLLVGLYVLDRSGVIRAVGSRPARALAARMLGKTVYEKWLAIDDHAVAAISVPFDPTRAEACIALLSRPDLTILAVETAEPGPTVFPTDSGPVAPAPGDRVVVLGPQRALDPSKATW